MLFSRKKKKSEPSPSFTISVPYSKTYKGFKRMKLATYQDPLVDLDAIRNAPDPGRVLFEEYLFDDTPPLLRVSFDGIRLGTIWSSSWAEYYDAIRNGRVSAVSLGLNATDVYLFLKIVKQ